MRDPRLAVLPERFSTIERVVGVTGGKGGIGKTFVATTLALALSARGRRVGLLDLDLTGPCGHLFLGVQPEFPEEKGGVIPPVVSGVRFMTLALFGGDRPAPLRGADVTEAAIEILAITRWGQLDTLVVDFPPGLGDALMDALRLVPRVEFLAVANASRVVVETVRRTIELLRAVDAPVIGVVENMSRDPNGTAVRTLAADTDTAWLGRIPYDAQLEAAVGDPDRLLDTEAGHAVRAMAAALDASRSA